MGMDANGKDANDDEGEKEAVRILPEALGSWASSCEEAQEGLLLFNNVNLSLSWVLLHNTFF